MLANLTLGFVQSPQGQQIARRLVPKLTIEKLEHFIPSRTKSSSVRPFSTKAMHNLGTDGAKQLRLYITRQHISIFFLTGASST